MTDNSMKSIYQKRTRIGDNILKVLIYLAAGVAIALLVGIMGYVFVRGLPQVSWQLLSTVQSSLKGTFGILGNIINTIYIIVITLIIAAPIGIGSAIYLNEYAKPGKLVRTIEFTTEILSVSYLLGYAGGTLLSLWNSETPEKDKAFRHLQTSSFEPEDPAGP